MALSPERIQELREKHGIPDQVASGSSAVSASDRIAKLRAGPVVPAEPKEPAMGGLVGAGLDKFQSLFKDRKEVKEEDIKPGMIRPLVGGEKPELPDVSEEIVERAGRLEKIEEREDTPLIEKGVQKLGQGAGLAADALEKTVQEVAEEIPGVKKIFEAVGSGFNWLVTSDKSPIKKIGEEIGSREGVIELVNLYDTDENFRDTVDGVANIARLGFDIEGAVSAPAFTKNVTNKIKTKVAPATKVVKETVETGAETAKKFGKDIFQDVAEDVSKAKAIPKESLNKFRGKLDNVAVKDAEKAIGNLTQSTKPLSKESKRLSGIGVDIKAELADLNIYKGLQVENGAIIPDGAISTVQNRIDNAMEMKRQFLPKIDEFGPEITKQQLREKAVESLKGQGLSPADELAMIKKINNQLDPLPDSMKPSAVDDLRARFRRSSRDAKGQQKSQNQFAALENSSRDLVFEAAENLPFDTAGQLPALNNYIRQQIAISDFLDVKLRGQKVKGGRLGTRTGQVVGAVAGSSGGILGSILGAEVGGAVAKILTNNQLGSSMKMKLIQNLTDNTQILDEVAKLLDIAEDFEVPALPAPAPGAPRSEVGSGAPIAPGKLPSAVEAAEAAAREVGDIKTDFKSPAVGQTVKEITLKDSMKHLEREGGGITVDPDALKTLANDLDPKNHAIYSAKAKEVYKEALKTSKNPVVKFTAGGSGSGKSEGIIFNIKKDFDGIIVDGTLAKYDSTVKKMNQAIKAGKTVEIYGIVPDIKNSWKFVQKRAEETGRKIEMDEFIRMHSGALTTLKKLLDSGKNVALKDARKTGSKAELRAKEFIGGQEALDILAKIDYTKGTIKKLLDNG